MAKRKRDKTIMLECPECGTTKRNFRTEYDPPEATLLVIRCPGCSAGCKEDGGTYYNARGEEVEYRISPARSG